MDQLVCGVPRILGSAYTKGSPMASGLGFNGFIIPTLTSTRYFHETLRSKLSVASIHITVLYLFVYLGKCLLETI